MNGDASRRSTFRWRSSKLGVKVRCIVQILKQLRSGALWSIQCISSVQSIWHVLVPLQLSAPSRIVTVSSLSYEIYPPHTQVIAKPTIHQILISLSTYMISFSYLALCIRGGRSPLNASMGCSSEYLQITRMVSTLPKIVIKSLTRFIQVKWSRQCS